MTTKPTGDTKPDYLLSAKDLREERPMGKALQESPRHVHITPNSHLLSPETRESLSWYIAAGPDPTFCGGCGKFGLELTYKGIHGLMCDHCGNSYKGSVKL